MWAETAAPADTMEVHAGVTTDGRVTAADVPLPVDTVGDAAPADDAAEIAAGNWFKLLNSSVNDGRLASVTAARRSAEAALASAVATACCNSANCC